MKTNIFVNTIPHSGTHLVSSLLDQIGFKHSELKYRFYSEKPFFRRWQRAGINWRTSTALENYLYLFSKDEVPVSVASPRSAKSRVVANLFKATKGGEYIIGHMPYSDAGRAIIQKYIAKTITIVRDPRDMALSMMNHIKTRPSHMAHNYLFKHLKDDNSRLHAIVTGYKNDFGSLVGIEKMYTSMLEWEKVNTNITLRFENLVGLKGGGSASSQVTAIRCILDHLELFGNMTIEKIHEIGSSSFGKTTTFRKGQIGGWKSRLTEHEKQIFKQNVNHVLVDLNYESNLDW